VKRFRGGFAVKIHKLFYLSTVGSRVIKKKKGGGAQPAATGGDAKRNPAGGGAAPLTQYMPGQSAGVSTLPFSISKEVV
jgi:hypothetical protein